MTGATAGFRNGTLQVLSQEHTAEYDRFIESLPNALIYATSAYRELLERFTKTRSRYLAARDEGGGLMGVFPTFHSAGQSWPPVMNSLPFYGSHGGIIGQWNSHVASALLDEVMENAKSLGCATATVIASPFDQPEQLAWYEANVAADLRDTRIGQVTFLPGRGEEWSAHFARVCNLNVRQAVQKARKVGVRVVRTDRAGLEFLARVHQDNMATIGGRAKPPHFFDLIGMLFVEGRDYRVFTGFIDDVPVAAVLNLYCNETVEYFTPVVVSEYRTTQALSLVIYEAMADAIASGYRRWNWGGTWASQTGVYDFKRRWGARDLPYHYFVRVFDRSILKSTADELLERYPYYYVVPFGSLEKS